MGDRGNIYVKDSENSGVYLYTNWRGHQVHQIAQQGLSLRTRWDDSPYLTRILFDAMAGYPTVLQVTGVGISSKFRANEFPVVVVDYTTQTVSFDCSAQFKTPEINSDFLWTFTDYVNLKPDYLESQFNAAMGLFRESKQLPYVEPEKVWSFYLDCGRMGSLSGLFLATQTEVDYAVGKQAHFYEALGKHSHVDHCLEKDDITLVTANSGAVEMFKEFFGEEGHNPIENIRRREEE